MRGRLFLQEQLHTLDARVGVEAPDHPLLEQIVAKGEQDHPLVVHHIRVDHRMAFAGLQAFRREIHRFIKTVRPHILRFSSRVRFCMTAWGMNGNASTDAYGATTKSLDKPRL